jgi:hypothetical protein
MKSQYQQHLVLFYFALTFQNKHPNNALGAKLVSLQNLQGYRQVCKPLQLEHEFKALFPVPLIRPLGYLLFV